MVTKYQTAVARLQRNDPGQTMLSLHDNQITDISALCTALAHNTVLTKLYLNHNRVTDVTALGVAVATNTTLTILCIGWNGAWCS